jgi:hypothetical protein
MIRKKEFDDDRLQVTGDRLQVTGGEMRAGGACPDVLWQEIEIGIIPPGMLTGGFNPPRWDAND